MTTSPRESRPRFQFTAGEIDAVRHDFTAWHRFVRRREFELLMSLFPGRLWECALELGAGDGGQSETIAKYCRHLVCTELSETGNALVGRFHARGLANVEYRLCDAQDLSAFADASFDLVFSSNMLEHVPDAVRCLRECRRVVREDGVIVHTMPGQAWKAASYALSWARYRKGGAVHGISPTHWQEFREFRPSAWHRKFREAGLRLVSQVGLPFYVGHGNRYVPITKLGNACGMSATHAYVLQK